MNHFRGDSSLIKKLTHNLHQKAYSKVCQNRTLLANPKEEI